MPEPAPSQELPPPDVKIFKMTTYRDNGCGVVALCDLRLDRVCISGVMVHQPFEDVQPDVILPPCIWVSPKVQALVRDEVAAHYTGWIAEATEKAAAKLGHPIDSQQHGLVQQRHPGNRPITPEPRQAIRTNGGGKFTSPAQAPAHGEEDEL